MCGCAKNVKAVTPLSALKTADQLVAEGVAVWCQYNGLHPQGTTRRGEATGTRYSVTAARCVLLAVEDYEAFKARNAGEFTPCEHDALLVKATAQAGAIVVPVADTPALEVAEPPAKKIPAAVVAPVAPAPPAKKKRKA